MSGLRTSRSMLHYCLLLSWFGSASLQYINTGPAPGALINPLVSNYNARVPYVNYFTLPPQGESNAETDNVDSPDSYNQFYQRGEYTPVQRRRRSEEESKHWLPNVIEEQRQPDVEDKTVSPEVYQNIGKENETNTELFSLRKRSFSPWGGKRTGPINVEQMWTWKRESRNREPNMPKRVRFSPWGGKRSGQVIYKPGSKVNRVIYTSIPALTRILSNYSPSYQTVDSNGYKFIPNVDKRHPIKILTGAAQAEYAREALPFKNFLTSLPPMFKLGHPYVDLSLKNDGKRKVIFSQWGGKRTAPIIGPIWTPAPGNVKDATLDALLLIRNNNIDNIGNVQEETIKAF